MFSRATFGGEAVIATLTLNPSLDESATARRVEPERKLRCEDFERQPGGGGLNVARALGELGGQAIAIWARAGHTGAMVADLLDRARVRSVPLDVAGETRRNLSVLETSSGREFRFGLPGPALSAADEEEFLSAVDPLPADGWVVASGSLPPGVSEAFYARVAERLDPSTRLVVDTSGPALAHAVRAGVFAVKPNLRELGELVGRTLRDEEDAAGATLALARSGGARVVLTSLGAAGAVMASGDALFRLRAPPVPVQSKVGAGDSMVAGLVLGLARGASPVDAARLAVAAGAAAVMTPASALCRRADVERLYPQITVEERGAPREHEAPGSAS